MVVGKYPVGRIKVAGPGGASWVVSYNSNVTIKSKSAKSSYHTDKFGILTKFNPFKKVSHTISPFKASSTLNLGKRALTYILKFNPSVAFNPFRRAINKTVSPFKAIAIFALYKRAINKTVSPFKVTANQQRLRKLLRSYNHMVPAKALQPLRNIYKTLLHLVWVGGVVAIDPNPGNVVTQLFTPFGSGTTNPFPGLSTSNINDLIVVDIEMNPAGFNINQISVTSPTLGTISLHTYVKTGNIGDATFRYYAVAPGLLTNEIITIHLSGVMKGGFLSAIAYAVSNANTVSPFDSGGPVAVGNNSAGVDPLSITTHNPCTMVIGTYREATVANTAGLAGAGCTQIGAITGGYLLTEYQVVPPGTYSVPQSGTAIGNANGGIVDAVVAANLGFYLIKAIHKTISAFVASAIFQLLRAISKTISPFKVSIVLSKKSIFAIKNITASILVRVPFHRFFVSRTFIHKMFVQASVKRAINKRIITFGSKASASVLRFKTFSFQRLSVISAAMFPTIPGPRHAKTLMMKLNAGFARTSLIKKAFGFLVQVSNDWVSKLKFPLPPIPPLPFVVTAIKAMFSSPSSTGDEIPVHNSSAPKVVGTFTDNNSAFSENEVPTRISTANTVRGVFGD